MGQLPSIGWKVPGNDGGIPVTHPFLLYHLLNPAAHVGSLPCRVASLVHLDALFLSLPGPAGVPVQVLFQKIQLRALIISPGRTPAADYVLLFRDSMLFCHGGHAAHRMTAHIKQMLDTALLVGVFPGINGNRTYHLPGVHQEQLHQPVLDRSKAGISVQKNDAVFEGFPLWKLPAQDVQNLLSRDIMALYILPETAVNHLQVLKLLGQKRRIRLSPHFPQHIRCDTVLVQLRDLGLKLADEAGLLQMPTVEGQLSSL